MKVLFVSDYYPFYGGKVVFEIANRLSQKGLITDILSSNAIDDPNPSYLEKNLSPVTRLRSRQISIRNTSYIIYDIRDLKLVRKHLDVDIIHLHFLHGFLPLYIGALKKIKQIGIPIIATSHGLTSGYSSSIVQGTAILLKELSRRLIISNASAITTVSKTEYDYLKKNISSEKLKFIPNGVDAAYFKSDSVKRESFRKKLGFVEKDIIILFFSHLRSTKGVITFLNAIEKVININNNFKFIIAGSGPLSYMVKDAAIKYPDRVISLLGYVPDEEIPFLFNASDIYVLPSFVEGMPLSVMEAMANGKPVIVTNVGDIPVFVENNVNGVVISPGNVALLADTIAFLGENYALRKKMSIANIKKMKAYNWNEIAVKYYELYAKTLSQ